MFESGVLGVDIGGVVIDRANDNTDTSFFSGNYLRTTAVPGVFDALHQLVSQRFGGQVYLVSKCGRRVQEKTLHWLEYHNFYLRTGIAPEHVKFCVERHQKAGICEELGITHFVDDRLEVLGYLTYVVSKLYLFQASDREVSRYAHVLSRVTRVESWDEILKGELL